MIIRKEEINPIDFDGLSIFDYTAKLNENLSFAIINVPPGVSHRLSWSKRSDKYYYIIKGKLDFLINEKNYHLQKGDFCIIKKGEKFRYKNLSNKTSYIVLIHMPCFDINEEVFDEK